MKNHLFTIALLLLAFTLSCGDKEVKPSTREILTSGKWVVIEQRISPGVRMTNAASAPIITDLLAAFPCSSGAGSSAGSYFYFEADGNITIEVTCSQSKDYNKKLRGTDFWELS